MSFHVRSESESNHNFISCNEAWKSRRRAGLRLHKKLHNWPDAQSDAGNAVVKEGMDLENQEDWKSNDEEPDVKPEFERQK